MSVWDNFCKLINWKSDPFDTRNQKKVDIQIIERTKELSFNEYQKQAFTTAVYPEKGTGSVMAIVYTALGLGEAGEVQGKVKKIIRDHNGQLTPEMRAAIIKEISDLLWYMAALCTELNVTLEYLAKNNLEKLFDRQKRDVIKGSGDER